MRLFSTNVIGYLVMIKGQGHVLMRRGAMGDGKRELWDR